MSFVQGLLDRLLARAARLSSTAGDDPSRPRRARTMSAEEAEATAMDRAVEALHRGDVAKALEEIELFADYSSKPDTLTLHAHLLLLAGSPQRAHDVLQRALRASPGHAAVLEGLAALHRHQGATVEEFEVRMRILRATPRYTPRHVIDTMAAMMHAGARRPLVKGDVALLTKLFDQVAPLATPAERLEFAEWLFTIKSALGRARELAEASVPADASLALRTLKWTTLEDVPPEHALARHQAADELLPGTQLRTAELAEASVLPGVQWSPWLPAHDQMLHGFVTSRWITLRENPQSPLLMQNMWELLVRLPVAAPRRIEQKAVLIGSNPNYYHFVVEHLGRLAALDALGVRVDDALWVVGEPLLPYQADYLRLLGMPEDRVLPVAAGENLVFRHLVAPYPLARGGRQISPLIARWARETVAPRAGVQAQPATRRLYVSRAGAARRKVANEAQLLEWLQAEGFECVHPEELDVAQQIRLYSQACELIAPAGAALTNMLYMPAGARVTILYNSYLPPGVESLYFDYLARACGHRFAAVAGTPRKLTGEQVLDADFEVPLAALQAAVRADRDVANAP